MKFTHSITLIALLIVFTGCNMDSVLPVDDPQQIFTMPDEEHLHEGTWLQWPHNNGWDNNHVARYESSWVEMTRALHTGETVHIVAYDQAEKSRIQSLLGSEGIDLSKIDLHVWKTDDVWIRDNGPIFVHDDKGQLHITNWKFNGWGNKADFYNCNLIPSKIGEALGYPVVDVAMTNEGGSIEVDGKGTLMAKKSSILNNNRNPGWKLADVEAYFRKYLGVTNFIWLQGVKGQDITDDHIDGTARFANGNKIVTFYEADAYPSEYTLLKSAKNAQGQPYEIVHLPLTQNNVPGTGDRGFYMNYYIGNDVVLVPNYGDPMDGVANEIIQALYPNRRVVGIEAAELAKDGGMVHCVTQQQPI